MRTITRYSESVKASILAKAMASNTPSLLELAKENNMPYATLYSWKKQMVHQSDKENNASNQRPNDKSASQKLRCVIETIDKTTEEQAAYCRGNGIYPHHLELWQKQMLEGLGAQTGKAQKAEIQQNKSEVEQLKRDLHRKDKALAEVSALLILKKKANLLWGVDEDEKSAGKTKHGPLS
jgi:transposase